MTLDSGWAKTHQTAHFDRGVVQQVNDTLLYSEKERENERKIDSDIKANLHDKFIGLADSCGDSSQNNPGV